MLHSSTVSTPPSPQSLHINLKPSINRAPIAISSRRGANIRNTKIEDNMQPPEEDWRGNRCRNRLRPPLLLHQRHLGALHDERGVVYPLDFGFVDLTWSNLSIFVHSILNGHVIFSPHDYGYTFVIAPLVDLLVFEVVVWMIHVMHLPLCWGFMGCHLWKYIYDACRWFWKSNLWISLFLMPCLPMSWGVDAPSVDRWESWKKHIS